MEIIGDYEYLSKDLIGHGAFAVVYKGRHRKKLNPVAIKSITKKNLAKSQNLLGKEIKILKELTELHHENVVALLDCKESQHNVFLVMEYCNGGDLADYLAVKGTLSEDTIRLFLCQLAGAMKALFAKGIVHRDLKPQNILLSHNCGKSLPAPVKIILKIADFGFARFLQDGNMAATLCGSPMYMAPEVIMSLQYDAKADLWSLGTIVFQCLTGKAPFQAHTPQELKMFYEKNSNLAPKIPAGTSPELTDLLIGLLRRNAKERMAFDNFFCHAFLQRPQPIAAGGAHNIGVAGGEMPSLPFTPPKAAASPLQQKLTAEKVLQPQPAPTDADNNKIEANENNSKNNHNTNNNNNNNNNAQSSPDNSDDFVLVPNNIPTEACSGVDNKRNWQRHAASPPRPSSLPISEAKPVPTVMQHQQQQQPGQRRSSTQASPKNISAATAQIPRSQPITMKRSEHRNSTCDMSSISPPAVQFAIGTPPGSRHRSTSGGSLSGTPPPPSNWQVSPAAQQSPLRRSGNSSSPTIVAQQTVALSKCLPALGSPTLLSENLNNNAAFNHPSIHNHGLHGRAITLPNLEAATGGFQSLLNDHNIMNDFAAPELPAETLLDRDHNETLAKLNFVLALTDCILEVANARCAPLSALMSVDAPSVPPHAPENCKRAERLVLLVRALHLLSSGLNLASQQLQQGHLKASKTVKNVLSMMNSKYRSTLCESKKLNGTGMLQKANASNITADKLLYDHAIQMCQSAALDELFGNPEDCFTRYQTAQILLHSLAQKCNHPQDKSLLSKYKDAVEKRLYVLQKQGYIYTTDDLS